MTDRIECCHKFQSRGSKDYYDPLTEKCTNAAVVERDGRHYCNRHDPVGREAKAEANRIAALPREAFSYTQDACMALKSAVMRLRELGAVNTAAELEAIRLAADRVKVNMPATLAALASPAEGIAP